MAQYYAIRKADSKTIQHADGKERANHKYIKREKVGNKWKYWYENTKNKIKDELGYDEKEAYEKAAAEVDNATWRLNSVTKAQNAQQEYAKDLRKTWSKKFADDVLLDKEIDPKDPDRKTKQALQTMYQLLGQSESFIGAGENESVYREQEKLRFAEKAAHNTLKKYNKTPLGRLENAINKGKSLVSRLFKKNK